MGFSFSKLRGDKGPKPRERELARNRNHHDRVNELERES